MSILYLNKEIMNYYKELKKIKYDADLLRKIGLELGYRKDTLENFVLSSKGNFSKILKGKRPLNKDYIIPLEKILGIPVSKLIEPNAYTYLINKDDVPFLKGIKYYAYIDNMDLYINELSKLSDVGGKPIIFNQDEYGKYFLDYVVEYNSINAITFLYEYFHETYHLSIRNYNDFFCFNNKMVLNLAFRNSAGLTKMIASLNDSNLFFDLYDTYSMFITNGAYSGPNCVFRQDYFLEVILKNEHLFDNIFMNKEYKYYFSEQTKKKTNKECISVKTINPIINSCLSFALNNIDKYKKQAIKILKYGIVHNKNVLSKLNRVEKLYFLNDLGGVIENNKEIIDLLIVTSRNVEDEETNHLIQSLPKL